jgi:WD40 repeat protein
MRCHLTLIACLTLSLVAWPVTANAQDCPSGDPTYAIPRMASGGVAVVMPGAANRVRSAPNTGGAIVGSLTAGTEFTVLAGPACNNGIVWWQVQVGDVIGWTAESVDGTYFLEPLAPPPLPNLSVPPVPLEALAPPTTTLNESAVQLAFTGGESLLIAVVTEPRLVQQWQIETNRSFEVSFGPQDAPVIFYAENLQPDGQGGDVIVSGDLDGRVFMWSPFNFTWTEEPIAVDLAGFFSPVYAASPPSDFTRVAIGGCVKSGDTGCEAGGATVFDLSDLINGNAPALFDVGGHTREIVAMAVNDDNTLLATASADGDVRLWSLDNGTEMGVFTAADFPLTSLAFTPNGVAVGYCAAENFGVCETGVVAAYDTDGARLWERAAHAGFVPTLDVSADGSRLLSGGGDGAARVWDTAHGTLLETYAPAGIGPIADVRFFVQNAGVALAGVDQIAIYQP